MSASFTLNNVFFLDNNFLDIHNINVNECCTLYISELGGGRRRADDNWVASINVTEKSTQNFIKG